MANTMRRVMSVGPRSYLAALLALTACGGSGRTAAGTDAGRDGAREAGIEAGEVGGGEVAASEVGEVGATPGACATPLSGAGPFGQVLAGEASFVSDNPQGPPPRAARLELMAYFPTGRRPGGSVILAMPVRFPTPALAFTSPAVLDANGGVAEMPGLSIGDELGSYFDGALVGPVDGLLGKAGKDFAFGTDVSDSATAPSIRLCPAGPVPAARLVGEGGAGLPTQPLIFAPSTPFDPDVVPNLVVRAGGIPVPTTVTFGRDFRGGSSVVLTPVAAFPPGRTLTIDRMGFADVLGRPYVVEALPAPLHTIGAVLDLTFTTAPPAGAVAELVTSTSQPTSGAPAAVKDGVLVMGAVGIAQQRRTLISLGDGGNLPTVRVRLGVACVEPSGVANILSVGAALVAADGQVAHLPIACGPIRDHRLPRPAPGPLWLALVFKPDRGHPQMLPPRGGNAVELDEVTFE